MNLTEFCPCSLVVLIISLWIIFCVSPKTQFVVKFLFYYSYSILLAVFFIPYSLLNPKDVRNSKLAARFISLINLLYGLKWRVKGLDHLTMDRSVVVVCNHQSSIDVLGMFELWPSMDKCAAVAKRELMYTGPFGLVAWLNGTVFIDRGNSDKAKKALNKTMEEVKKKKIKLWIFPEGTRSCSKTLLPFKKGAFHLAIDYQVPILPIVFGSYSKFLNHEKKVFDSGDINVTVLPAISTEGLTIKDLPELLDKTRNQMQEVLSAS